MSARPSAYADAATLAVVVRTAGERCLELRDARVEVGARREHLAEPSPAAGELHARRRIGQLDRARHEPAARLVSREPQGGLGRALVPGRRLGAEALPRGQLRRREGREAVEGLA